MAGGTLARRHTDWHRLARLVNFAATVLILLLAALQGWRSWQTFASAGLIGVDLETYRIFAQRWLDTGSMYLPAQFAPFDPQPLPHIPERMPSMYPPTAVLLFAPFLILPDLVWYAIPLAVIGYALWRWRPATWTWPILALVLLYPPTVPNIISGNTTPWIIAAMCGGLIWGWPSLLILLKPSLLPLAFIGVRRRAWWLGAAALAAVSALFLGEWLAYISVVENAETSLAYSLGGLPLYAAPFVVYMSRQRR